MAVAERPENGLDSFDAGYLIGLGSFRPLDDVELYLVTFLQGFVAVQLNRAVVYEDIRTVVTAEESVPLGIIEPLHCTFELRHLALTFLSGFSLSPVSLF